MHICKPKLSAARPSLTLKNVPVVYIRLLYDHLILKSLGTHIAQTRLIPKSSVRILNTEDLLTPHMDPTSLNLRLLWWCHEYGISRYPYLTDVFQISQISLIPSEYRVYHLYTHDLDTVWYFSDPSIIFWSRLAFSQAERRKYMCDNCTLFHAHCDVILRAFLRHFLKVSVFFFFGW
jgi:hypothetical protein